MGDMRELAERVARAWREAGAEPRHGVDARALDDFRLHNGVSIPEELAAFHRVTNGIESDANMFAVWGLGEIRRVPEALGDFRGSPDYGEIANTLPDANTYFVFADWMIWSHVFAVKAPAAEGGVLGPVVWICGSEHGVVAPTLADFWERYLVDPEDAVIV